MKKIMLVGCTSAGKTSFCQAMYEIELRYKKTQTIELIHDAIDTPGEYVENRALYKALLVTAADADCVVMVQSATDAQSSFAPGICGMFNKPVIGLITKIDVEQSPEKIARADEWLELAGCQMIFHVSNLTGDGILTVKKYLETAAYNE